MYHFSPDSAKEVRRTLETTREMLTDCSEVLVIGTKGEWHCGAGEDWCHGLSSSVGITARTQSRARQIWCPRTERTIAGGDTSALPSPHKTEDQSPGGLSPNAVAMISGLGGRVSRLTTGTTTKGRSMVMAPANGTPSAPQVENRVQALARPTPMPA